MRNIFRAAQRVAIAEEAVMLRARVPSGSLSHLSGKRFAAPSGCQLCRRNEQCELTMNDDMWSSARTNQRACIIWSGRHLLT